MQQTSAQSTGMTGDGYAQLGASTIGAVSQAATNAQNQAMSREQMEFQRWMSGTAYVRQKIDMQAAGLNPMLGYMQGGASTPQGAASKAENPLGGLTGDVNSALANKRDQERVKNETKMITETIRKTNSEVSNNEVQNGILKALKTQEEAKSQVAAANLPAEIKAAKQRAAQAPFEALSKLPLDLRLYQLLMRKNFLGGEEDPNSAYKGKKNQNKIPFGGYKLP